MTEVQEQPDRRKAPRAAAPRQRRARQRPAADAPQLDLRTLVDSGARLRRHRFLGNLRAMIVPLLASGLAQAVVYALFYARAIVWSVPHLVIASTVLFLGPLCVGLLLAAVGRTRFPFTAAFAATAIVFNSEVVILAALRISVTYWGLLAAAALALVGSLVANMRLHRGLADRVAILDFPNAELAGGLIGGKPTVITDPATDVAPYDIVLFDGQAHHVQRWSQLLTRAHMQGAELTPWISYLEQRRGRVDVEAFDMAHLAYTASQIYYVRIKRAFDLVLLVLTLPVTVPLGLLIWLYIKAIDGGGPAFFVQTRRGYGGRNFRMYKFRTMYRGTHGGAAAHGDSRIMPGCKLLRRLRLDELPQIINIWKGQMSWIGPRPESIELARRYETEMPEYLYRLLVLPGITGWAQVNNGYTSTVTEARIKLSYDLYYLKNISFDLDLEILLRTVRTLLLRDGAR